MMAWHMASLTVIPRFKPSHGDVAAWYGAGVGVVVVVEVMVVVVVVVGGTVPMTMWLPLASM
jgi:hypothetical protein